jgi:formylglycine-generating enzyme required for sulfatase activity
MKKLFRNFLFLFYPFFIVVFMYGCENISSDDTILMPEFDMVTVGEKGVIYTVPIGVDDSSLAYVEGGFQMATLMTTYALWYEVIIWAKDNGYTYFEESRYGQEGSNPVEENIEPTELGRDQPVTRVSYRQLILWLNALSEMAGLDPVYRNQDGDIIREHGLNTSQKTPIDEAIQADYNGFRLPTSDEWEMAARWKNDTVSIDGSIYIGERYWTPGNYPSGSNYPYDNHEATGLVGWYARNSLDEGLHKTRPVGLKNPNHLGLFDMCGNAWEITYTKFGTGVIARGGGYQNYEHMMQVGFQASEALPTGVTSSGVGFRIVKNAV